MRAPINNYNTRTIYEYCIWKGSQLYISLVSNYERD